MAVALDGAGNLYVAGGYIHSQELNPGGAAVSSRGSEDVFLAKLSGSGTILWVQNAGGPGTDRAQGVVSDGAGGAIITGFFEQTARFSGSSTTLTSAGERDVLVARYDAGGGPGDDAALGVRVDSQGTANITGSFSGTATFGPYSLEARGVEDMYTARVSPAGVFSFFAPVGGDRARARGNGVALGSGGSVVAVGTFDGNLTYGGLNLTNNGKADVLLTSLESTSGPSADAAPADGAMPDGAKADVTTPDAAAPDATTPDLAMAPDKTPAGDQKVILPDGPGPNPKDMAQPDLAQPDMAAARLGPARPGRGRPGIGDTALSQRRVKFPSRVTTSV